MGKLYNLARMTTATTGTGTITLGSAVSGYLTFAQAGVADADVIDYAIKDGSNSEIGTGTYTSSGTTLTRTVTKSTNSNAAINLSGTAEVFISPRAETLNDASVITTGTVATARLGSGTANSTTVLYGDQTYKTAPAPVAGDGISVSTNTVSINTNNALGIASYVIAIPSTGTTASGSTLAGSSLKVISFDTAGGIVNASATTLSGTWRNVSGISSTTNSGGGLWIRTA